MTVVTLPALLLRSYPWGESSRILRFLTAEHGVVSVIARGVRGAPKRGTASPTEPFSSGHLTLDFRPGRDLQGFRSFDVETPRRAIAGNLVRFGGAAFLAELILRHAAVEGTPDLLPRIEAGLDALTQADDEGAARQVLETGWCLIGMLGYAPELDVCVQCGAPIEPEAMTRFDHREGGVRGSECLAPDGGGPGPRLGPLGRALIARMLAGEALDALPSPGAQFRLLHDFITWHLGTGGEMDTYSFLAGQLRENEVNP